jgi:hypothetical protein
MITSKQQEFSNAQAITTASAVSTNVIDLGVPGTVVGGPAALTRDIGPGEPIAINIEVTTAFTGEGTLTIQVQVCDTTSMSGATTVAATAALSTAQLGTAGYQASIAVLPNKLNKRYLGLNYSLTTSSFTAGAITAGIVAGVQTNKAAGRA